MADSNDEDGRKKRGSQDSSGTSEELTTGEALDDVFDSSYEDESLVDTMDALKGREDEENKKEVNGDKNARNQGSEDRKELERVLSDIFDVDDEFLEDMEKMFEE